MCSKCYRDTQLNAERKASNSKAAISALSEVHGFPEVPEVLGAKTAQPHTQPLPAAPQQPAAQQSSLDSRDQPQKEASSEKAVKVEASLGAGDDGLFERPAQKPGRCFTCNKKVRTPAQISVIVHIAHKRPL